MIMSSETLPDGWAEEQDLTQGIIVNKFYGEKEYFEQGKEQLEKITGKPVLEVIPYIDLQIEDEDVAVGERLKTREGIECGLAQGVSSLNHLKEQFDRLEEFLRENLDLERLYEAVSSSQEIE